MRQSNPNRRSSTPILAPKLKPLTAKERAEPLDVETFFRIISLTMKEGSNVVCDTGDALIGAIGLRTAKPNNFLADAYYLSMGFGVAGGHRRHGGGQERAHCIAIVGDGAFQMTGMELSTAAKEGFKPIVCIINNDGYGTQRHIIDGKFNNIHPWKYTKICDMLGYGRAARVTTKGEFRVPRAQKRPSPMTVRCI